MFVGCALLLSSPTSYGGIYRLPAHQTNIFFPESHPVDHVLNLHHRQITPRPCVSTLLPRRCSAIIKQRYTCYFKCLWDRFTTRSQNSRGSRIFHWGGICTKTIHLQYLGSQLSQIKCRFYLKIKFSIVSNEWAWIL